MVLTRELTFNLDGNINCMGLPVNGTKIRLYDYWHGSGALTKHFLREQTTNNKGSFSFDVRKGIYSIEVVPNDNTRYARQTFEAIRITNNKTLNINLKAGSILSGTVRDSSGAAINDAEILVFGIEPHVLKTSQKVDENGQYSIPLPTGKYYLAVNSVKNTKQTETEQPSDKVPFICPTFEVVELKKDTRRDLVLPTLRRICGRVRDVAGHPMFGVKVVLTAADSPDNIFARDLSFEAVTFTRLDGTFECLVKHGNYTARLSPPLESRLSEKTFGPLHVDEDMRKDFVLEPGYHLHGKILHQHKPVPNVCVNIIGSRVDSYVLTNQAGEYTITLPAGKYDLIMTAQPDSLCRVTDMELAACKTNIEIEGDTFHSHTMESGVVVAGVVHDSNKQACAGMQISIYPYLKSEGERLLERRRSLWDGITGDDGSYEFRLMPDHYWLVLNNQTSTKQKIEVSGSKFKNNILVNDVCILDLDVFSDDDQPIANCQIIVEPFASLRKADAEQSDYKPELFPPAFTENNGHCSLALPQGIYVLQLVPPEHGSYQPRQIKQLSVGADMSRRIRLEEKETA